MATPAAMESAAVDTVYTYSVGYVNRLIKIIHVAIVLASWIETCSHPWITLSTILVKEITSLVVTDMFPTLTVAAIQVGHYGT